MKESFDIADAIAAFIRGEATPGQLRELDRWTEESEDNRRLFASLMSEEAFAQRTSDLDSAGLEEAFARVRRGKERSRGSLPLGRVAAVVSMLVVLAGGWLMLDRFGGQEVGSEDSAASDHRRALITLNTGEKILLDRRDTVIMRDGTSIRIAMDGSVVYEGAQADSRPADSEIMYNSLETGGGMEYQLVLSDGTKVWMNAGSSLRYPVKFTGDTREVELKGEAYFDVSHNEMMPFVVKTPRAEVTVLGTEFCVKDYPDEGYRTTLVEGSVAVKDHTDGSHVIAPGQQVRIDDKGTEVLYVETSHFTSWKDGYFAFHETALVDIMRTLSRWYDFDYVFENEKAANTKMTARIRKYDDLNAVLDILSLTGDTEFSLSARDVTIR